MMVTRTSAIGDCLTTCKPTLSARYFRTRSIGASLKFRTCPLAAAGGPTGSGASVTIPGGTGDGAACVVPAADGPASGGVVPAADGPASGGVVPAADGPASGGVVSAADAPVVGGVVSAADAPVMGGAVPAGDEPVAAGVVAASCWIGVQEGGSAGVTAAAAPSVVGASAEPVVAGAVPTVGASDEPVIAGAVPTVGAAGEIVAAGAAPAVGAAGDIVVAGAAVAAGAGWAKAAPPAKSSVSANVRTGGGSEGSHGHRPFAKRCAGLIHNAGGRKRFHFPNSFRRFWRICSRILSGESGDDAEAGLAPAPRTTGCKAGALPLSSGPG